MRTRPTPDQHTPALPARKAQLVPYLMADISRFSHYVIGLPLYDYQADALRPVVDAVLNARGQEFLLVFPRQSGKNEAVAQLLVYLLALYQRRGSQIVFGAIGDGLGRARQRLEERLDNPLTRHLWRREARPQRIALGNAAVAFISTHPRAASRGATADHLLVIDEAQDQDTSHIEAVFTPMRAARNASAVYLGTVRTTNDFLWQKKAELEAMTERDGLGRVFLVGPERVCAENPAYAAFLANQVARYGRQHPIIASEYYLEPLNNSGRLFTHWRQTLMRGTHSRQTRPRDGATYVATVDVAGQDEMVGAQTRLGNPARDYTVATIFELAINAAGQTAYHAVDAFVDQGSRHFQDVAGSPRLADRLLGFLQHWQVVHVVVDASGVGQGLADWLSAALGVGRLTQFLFSGRTAKAALGSDFLALVDTGRFKYWCGDEDEVLSDGWWFWQQVESCTFAVGSGGHFDRDLRWSVPAGTTVQTPQGTQPVHDDRLISAALVAVLDRRAGDGGWRLGQAQSQVVGGPARRL